MLLQLKPQDLLHFFSKIAPGIPTPQPHKKIHHRLFQKSFAVIGLYGLKVSFILIYIHQFSL